MFIKDYCETKVSGELLGFELEVEDKEPLPTLNNGVWSTVGDGSLRGHNAEYITKKPLSLEEMTTRVKALVKFLEELNVETTGRTGTHVHVNVQDLSHRQLWTSLVTTFLFEPLLTRHCGDCREGNGFCLGPSEAQTIFRQCESVLESDGYMYFSAESFKYSSINLSNITHLGTVEFRALSGEINEGKIVDWLKVCHNTIYNSYRRFSDPDEVMDYFLNVNLEKIRTLLSYLIQDERIVSELLSQEDVVERVTANLGSISLIAYATDWDTLDSRMTKDKTRNYF